MAHFRTLRDRALAYGIYGGTPRYLASINVRRTLTVNVVEGVLSPAGAVRGQVETIVAQEHGLRDIAQYSAVLNAIGAGATDRNEIAQQTGLGNDFSEAHRDAMPHDEHAFHACRSGWRPQPDARRWRAKYAPRLC